MRFTYTVSHDLKSPLVTIQSFLGYLEQDLAGQDSGAAAKDRGFIRDAAQKMTHLLDDLLQLSRVGRVKSPSKDVPLRSAVAEAQALVAGHIAQRGARIVVTSEPIILHGDPIRFTELFQNLLDNAVKFMGAEPAPLVEVMAEKTDGEIIITVRDNGIGIDPRHAAKLFGLFEKLDVNSQGTGIGLALARRIVEVHGGRIWVESAGPGQGSSFRFTLAGTRVAESPEGQMT
jgi:signal transduction histidine kinase